MKFTGERYLPDHANTKEELSVEHLHRYNSILPLVKNKTVLDIACGEGYGSALIAKTARSVQGIDISDECIQHASQKYGTRDFPNLSFLKGEVEKIPANDNTFDVIVSFETIEHVSEAAQKTFLQEVKRVLKKGGLFIVSTPDEENYSKRYEHVNEFHLHELARKDFQSLLTAHFSSVRFFEQGFEILSLIIPTDYSDIEQLRLVNWQPNANPRKGKYLIAIASDKPVEAGQVASVVVETDKDYLKQVDRIVELQNEVETLSSWGRNLDTQRIQHEAVINALKEQIHQDNKNELQQLTAKVEELQRLFTEQGRERQVLIDSLTAKSEQQQQVIKNLENNLEEHLARQEKYKAFEDQLSAHFAEKEILNIRNNSLEEQLKQQIIEREALHGKNNTMEEQLTKYIAEQELLNEKNNQLINQLTTKSVQLKEREQIFHDIQFNFNLSQQQLKDLNTQLTTIYESDGWKLLKRYYNLKGKYLNENSAHYKFLRRTLNLLRRRKMTTVPVLPPGQVKTEQFLPEPKTEPVPVRTLPHFEHPVVSIVIPVYNAWDMNVKCVTSILNNTTDASYEVIIADDCSTDLTSDISNYFKNIVHVRNENNLGFLKNCNNAATRAKGKYIYFLNNDTEVQAGWLSSLIMLAEKDETIGMVGSKLIYPDGTLQEAGGIIWKDASGWNYGHRQDPDKPEFNYVKEVDYISGASIMVRKDIWQKTGGFDTRYSPAYFEDTDMAFQVRKLGYKVMYQPLSVVMHYEGVSHGTSTTEGIKKYQVINTEKFIEKWKDELDTHHFPNGEKVFWARDRSRNKKTIVVIDHYVPHFDKDAGSRTTYQLLRLFTEMNYNVKFIGDNFYKHEPYTTIMEQMGVEVLYGPWYRDNWQKWILENSEMIDFIYLNRPHISIKYIDFLRENTKAKIVYYGHDLHFVREMRQYELEKDPLLLESMKEWKQTETYLIQKSDTVLTLSCEEKEIMETELLASDVKTMPAFFYNEFKAPVSSFLNRKDILFIAGFNHRPNVDAVLWFAREVWPLVTGKLKNTKFMIVGSLPPDEVLSLESSTINVKGYVTDAQLNEIYDTVKMVVVPLRYGAGVKGKTVEAMSQGLPLISTSFGIEGLTNVHTVLQPVDDAAEFANKIINLYNNEKELINLSEKEINYAKLHFSKNVVQKLIAETF